MYGRKKAFRRGGKTGYRRSRRHSKRRGTHLKRYGSSRGGIRL